VAIARNSIAAKIANCRSVLLRAARDTNDKARQQLLTDAARVMARQLEDVRQVRAAPC
jgi:CRISPR-associated protein Cas1